MVDYYPVVALRKESVDRNYAQAQLVNGVQVALRKESVDRNAQLSTLLLCNVRRSPQGERG